MFAVGLNTGAEPDITYVPPHEPVYHIQLAGAPKLPPVTPRVVLPPEQIGDVPDADVAGVDNVLTVIFAVAQVVVLHVPDAST